MIPVQDENDEVDLKNLKIVLRFVDKDFSRYTLFAPLFKFSKSFLRLEEKFSRYLKLKYKPKRYPVAKMADSVVSLVCCGVDRFVRMDDEFRIERGLAKSLGFPHGFFTSRTVYRFFQSFNGLEYPSVGEDQPRNAKRAEGVLVSSDRIGLYRFGHEHQER